MSFQHEVDAFGDGEDWEAIHELDFTNFVFFTGNDMDLLHSLMTFTPLPSQAREADFLTDITPLT
jgi:hypothetical protein